MKNVKKLSALVLALILSISAFTACGGEEPPANSDVNNEPTAPEYTEGLVFVTDEGGCFVSGYNGNDTDVIIPDEYEGKKVVRIAGSAFFGNENITSVKLGTNVKNIGAAAFAGCTSLKSAELGDALASLDAAAFFGCSELVKVTLPQKLGSIGVDCFAGCESLENVVYNGDQSSWSLMNIGANNETIDDKLELADGASFVKILYQGNCNANISWRIGGDGVLVIAGEGAIPDYEFDNIPWKEYTDEIYGIVVEEGIDIVGKNAFLGCVNATKITIASTVRLIDNAAFSRCLAVEEIVLPERLRRIGKDAFLGCKSLRSIEIPDTVTAIGSGAFMDCESLESAKLSSAVTEIERWSFANCPSLKEIDLSAVTVIGTGAFFRCEKLSKVVFSNATAEIGDNAFDGCPKFAKVGTIPSTAVIGNGNGVIK